MKTTMDRAGRLVLPRAIRERAQFTPGAPLEIRVVDGRVEIEPAVADVTIERSGSFWVAKRKSDERRILTQEQVNATLDAVRAGDE